MSFLQSIGKYRSVYFHFLDGLLNTTAGGNFIEVLSTLREFIPGLFSQDITFANLNQKYQINLISTLTFIDRSSELEFKHDSEEIKQINPELFNFCIIPIVYNNHQTTTIIFTKKKKMHLYILNSGLDIEYNGNKVKIDSQDLYQLTKGIIICKDIRDKNELNNTYKFIKNFFLISYIYDNIQKHMYKKQVWNEEFRRASNIYTEEFINIIKILLISEHRSIFENIFKINNTDVNLDNIFQNLKTEYSSLEIEININYYVLVSNFINLNPLINIGSIMDINDYNQTVIQHLIRDKLSESFLKKIILYNQNGNLYIYPQESGSCTWFSTYFSILLYYVFYQDLSMYIDFIKNINDTFYEYILGIYTKDNFIRELQNDKNNYIYMKQLCSKLIDIKLIDNRILYDNLDTIYETEFTLNLTRNNTLSYSYVEDMDFVISFELHDNMEIIKNLFIKILPNFINLKKFYFIAYDIYRKKKGIYFFIPKVNFPEIIKFIDEMENFYEKKNVNL
jgi:hypothetical protein